MNWKCFKLLLLVAVLGVSAQANLLVNGDFESGLDGWTVYFDPENQYVGPVPGAVPGKGGEWVVEIYTATSAADWAVQLDQGGIPVGGNLPISFSLDFKASSSDPCIPAGVGLAIDCWDSVGGWLSYVWTVFYDTDYPPTTPPVPPDPGPTVWTYLDSDDLVWGSWPAVVGEYESDLGLITHPDTATISLSLRAWETTTLRVDNVVLIPEPATIAMLGLGGLALIRRRE